MKPLHSMIALRVDQQEEKTSAGIFLAKNEDHRAHIATVVHVGPGRITTSGLLIPPSVKVGDRVAFRDFAVKKNNKWYNPNEAEDLYFVDESDIMAVIEDETAPKNDEPVIDLHLEQVAFNANNS